MLYIIIGSIWFILALLNITLYTIDKSKMYIFVGGLYTFLAIMYIVMGIYN
jgi:hypothetical protein